MCKSKRTHFCIRFLDLRVNIFQWIYWFIGNIGSAEPMNLFALKMSCMVTVQKGATCLMGEKSSSNWGGIVFWLLLTLSRYLVLQKLTICNSSSLETTLVSSENFKNLFKIYILEPALCWRVGEQLDSSFRWLFLHSNFSRRSSNRARVGHEEPWLGTPPRLL